MFWTLISPGSGLQHTLARGGLFKRPSAKPAGEQPVPHDDQLTAAGGVGAIERLRQRRPRDLDEACLHASPPAGLKVVPGEPHMVGVGLRHPRAAADELSDRLRQQRLSE